MVGNLRKLLDEGRSQKRCKTTTAMAVFAKHYLTPERKAEMAQQAKVSSHSLLMTCCPLCLSGRFLSDLFWLACNRMKEIDLFE